MPINSAWIAKLKRATTTKPMTTLFLVLLGIIIAATLTFGIMLLRLSLDDADFWLKVFSGVLAALIFAIGLAALISGHFANQAQVEKILTLQKDNIAARLELEEETLTRIQLEKSLARREIPFIARVGKTNLDPLKAFAGTQVIMQFLPELEARRAAGGLYGVLEFTGWKMLRLAPNPELSAPFWDGVVVEAYSPFGSTPTALQNVDRWKSQEAADALVEFLKSNNWEARTQPSPRGSLPPNTILVKVGFKSLPHVPTKEERAFKEQSGFEEQIPQQRTEPRHLAPEKREAMLKSISETPRDVLTPVEVRCPASNPEACAFADEIVEVLRADKWPIPDGAAIRDGDFPRTLVGLWLKQYGERTRTREALLVGLTYAGIDAQELRTSLPTAASEPIQLLVGW